MKDINFVVAIKRARDTFKDAPIVHTERWQGIDISGKKEMATHEVKHHLMHVDLGGREDPEYYRRQIQPNLPWADDHFAERVCGAPINPGEQWRHWPWGHSAANFLDHGGMFNHNYMERYWPKFAGMLPPTDSGKEWAKKFGDTYRGSDLNELANKGIYHALGDLDDVVDQLVREPLTRQAMLPVFFPEDTGATHGGRVPCSIAYQFFMRNNKLDVSYWLRSCDFTRHFRDDIYLTIMLLLWVLQQCRQRGDERWMAVRPGEYVMLITSLHMFRNDFIKEFANDASTNAGR
jgi:thymidylate synthase